MECVCGTAHDRLSTQVERGVEDNRHSTGLPEPFNKSIVARVLLTKHHLQACRAIHMCDGGQRVSLVAPHRNDVQHVPSGKMLACVPQLKVRFCLLRQYGGSKRPIGLTKLDLGVYDIFHRGIARTPFEPSLEPAHHLSVHQPLDDLIEQSAVILELVEGDIISL